MEVPAIITDQQGQSKTIESLKGLLERLGSADLTLPEAKRLRCQLHRVLSEGGLESDQ